MTSLDRLASRGLCSCLTTYKELAGYRRNYEIAEKAYAALENAFASQNTVFDRPYFHDQRQYALAGLRKTLNIVRKRLFTTTLQQHQ